MMDAPGLIAIDVTPTSVTFTRGGSRPVTAYLDELDRAARKVATSREPEIQLHGAWLDESDISHLRAQILDLATTATVEDHCRKCGAETTRTDRLCDMHHGAAEDLRSVR